MVEIDSTEEISLKNATDDELIEAFKNQTGILITDQNLIDQIIQKESVILCSK